MRRMLLLAGMATFLFAFSANAQNSVNASSLKKQVVMEKITNKSPLKVQSVQVSDFSISKDGRGIIKASTSTRADAYNVMYPRPVGSFLAGVDEDGGLYKPLFIAPASFDLQFLAYSNANGQGNFSWYALNDNEQEVDLSEYVTDGVLSFKGDAGDAYFMPILEGEYNGATAEYRYGDENAGYVFFSPNDAFPLTNGDFYGDIYTGFDNATGFFPGYKVGGVPCTGFLSRFDALNAPLMVDHIILFAYLNDENGGDIIPAGTTMTVDLSKLENGTFQQPFATATATPDDCIELLDKGASTGVFVINFYFPNKQSAKIDSGTAFGALVNVTAQNNILLPFSENAFGLGSAYTLHGDKFDYFISSQKVNVCDIFLQLNGKFETDPSSIASAKSEADIKVVSSVNAFELTYPEAVTSVQVVNVAGQVIATYALEGTSATIPAANLVNGLYLLKFDNGATVKVMK